MKKIGNYCQKCKQRDIFYFQVSKLIIGDEPEEIIRFCRRCWRYILNDVDERDKKQQEMEFSPIDIDRVTAKNPISKRGRILKEMEEERLKNE